MSSELGANAVFETGFEPTETSSASGADALAKFRRLPDNSDRPVLLENQRLLPLLFEPEISSGIGITPSA